MKSGYVALIGKPNVGKSTLMNSMIGQKIAATSPRPQTTRQQILGICHEENAQIIFLDTPGMHHSDEYLNRCMLAQAQAALQDADLLIFMIKAGEYAYRDWDEWVAEQIKDIDTPKLLVINQADKTSKESILPQIEALKSGPWKEIVPISAINASDVKKLKNIILNYLPEGPAYFKSDCITDAPLDFIASEFIREQIFNLTGQEVPYDTAVHVALIEERRKVIYFQADIWVERESQKGILIGKKGQLIKKIGTGAREGLTFYTQKKIYLDLRVKMKKNWSSNPVLIQELGYQRI